MTFAEFTEKYKGQDVMEMSFEDEYEYKQDQFDMFETEGFTETFNTPYEECSEYNGQKYEIVRRASYADGDCDMECLPQWIIKFADGKEINAYAEEICKLEVNFRELEEKKFKYNITEINKTNTIMIDKKEFFTKLYETITDAIKQCDKGNVIDLRLFKNNNCLGDGVFSIFEGEELYNEVKDCKEWFVDFYENIKGENRAEFIDIVLHSNEFSKAKLFTPMFDNYDQLSLAVETAENKRRRCIADIIEGIQKEYGIDCIKFTDETSYPTFYDNTTNELESIVGAKAVDGILFLTTDATFSPMCWFNWTHYGEMDLDEFIYIVKQTLV